MKYDHPNDALRALASKLQPVSIQHAETDLVGRVLAQAIVADRDSPAADVSAMDGYAIRLSDIGSDAPLPVVGECKPGSPPVDMPAQGTVRVFTGAIVPADCEAVVKREDTQETESEIRLLPATSGTTKGLHIRRAGENAKQAETVLSPGIEIHAAHQATMSNFGCSTADVFRPVRVTILTTGDEVGLFGDTTPQPWQLRNSNRDSLTALLKVIPWISIVAVEHCIDDRSVLTDTLRERLKSCDAILMTGGVSMGDYDYVPDVIRDIGGDVVFHGLPIRPGKPVLGAATEDGKLLMGLPGNPVSATIGCRRLALPLLANLAGVANWLPHPPFVKLKDAGDKSIPLHWMRLSRMVD
ncbi:MAG: molybdopterin molybdotransferase MoeA, partial [Rubripirellula sp.]